MHKTSLLIVLSACCISAKATIYNGSCGTNLTWQLDTEDSTLVISGSGAMEDYERDTTIPWFDNLASIKTVSLPDGLTHVGARSFSKCENLNEVFFPTSLLSIGEKAFLGCTNLSKVDLPAGLEVIGNSAFERCAITTITIPSNVHSIGRCAFALCWALQHVGFNATNCADIDCGSDSKKGWPFLYCGIGSPDANLYEANSGGFDVTIGRNVRRIPGNIFTNWYSSGIRTGEWYIGWGVVRCLVKLNSVTFEEGAVCEEIGPSAFYADSITTITLPQSIKRIGYQAFYKADKLSQTKYEGTLDQWCGCEFMYYGNPVQYSNNLYISDTLVQNIVIHEGVDTLKSNLFYGDSFETVELPHSLKHIDYGAFVDCYGLTKVNYNGNADDWVQIILDGNPLEYAHNLHLQGILADTIVLSDAVETLRTNTFINGTCIKEIHLPSSMKRIESGALSGCSNISTIVCNAYRPPLAYRGSFSSAIFPTCALLVPVGSEEIYWTAEGWKEFNTIVEQAARPSGDASISEITITEQASNLPIVSVTTTDANATASITQANAVTMAATIEVTAANGEDQQTIVITFVPLPSTPTSTEGLGTVNDDSIQYDILGRPTDNNHSGVTIGNGKKRLQVR